jgi:hypothetical protein
LLSSVALGLFAVGTHNCANLKIGMIPRSMMMGGLALGLRIVNWSESRFRLLSNSSEGLERVGTGQTASRSSRIS